MPSVQSARLPGRFPLSELAAGLGQVEVGQQEAGSGGVDRREVTGLRGDPAGDGVLVERGGLCWVGGPDDGRRRAGRGGRGKPAIGIAVAGEVAFGEAQPAGPGQGGLFDGVKAAAEGQGIR